MPDGSPDGSGAAHPGSTGVAASTSTSGAAPGGLWADLRSLPFETLFPVRRWVDQRPWNDGRVRALLFFALFPSTLSLLYRGANDETGLRYVALAFSIYFALAWTAVLRYLTGTTPTRDLARRAGMVALLTIVLGFPLLAIVASLPIVRDLGASADDAAAGLRTRVLGWVLGIGVPEEAAKAVPVIWLALKSRSIRSPREAAFLGGISGLTFGVVEAADYAIRYAESVIISTDYLLAQTLRMTTLPLFHGLWAAIAGYYIGLGVLYPA
ncbi:MAG: PrsW family intramembrane metalloprotease, partial [Thermomicrobiaceae bacterium]|nr:PrsW family intramembrane metalloprotease [Thermomicrobiaceae bacterium]